MDCFGHSQTLQCDQFAPLVQVYDGVSRGYADVKYARCNNTPNHFALAKKLSELEGTEVGLACAFSADTWHGAGQ